jgi:hypothetical protein
MIDVGCDGEKAVDTLMHEKARQRRYVASEG